MRKYCDREIIHLEILTDLHLFNTLVSERCFAFPFACSEHVQRRSRVYPRRSVPVNMKILAPKIGALRMNHKKQNGDFSENALMIGQI
jgi:hypothetical protein